MLKSSILSFSLLVLLSNCILNVNAEYTDEALLDQIDSLPGAENLDLDFNQFSGYLQIGPNLSKNMVRIYRYYKSYYFTYIIRNIKTIALLVC